MNKNSKSIKIKQQSGLSLVELMISMVVGLFLLVGVVSNFLTTKNTDQKRVAVGEMDANATLAFEVLRQTISHAGYASIENVVPFDKAFYTKIDGELKNPTCRNGMKRDDVSMTPVKDFMTRDIDESGRDFLTVISLADNPCKKGFGHCKDDNGSNVNPNALVYTDCTGGGATRDTRTVSCSTDPDVGMPTPADAKLYSSFKLSKGANVIDDRVLKCYGNRGGGQPIIDNVEAIQYLYGVREDGSGNIKFRNANQVESANQWGMVTSVKIGLLLRSANQYVLDQKNDKNKYQVLDNTVKIADADLKRLFRVYTTTVNLENKNKGSLLPNG